MEEIKSAQMKYIATLQDIIMRQELEIKELKEKLGETSHTASGKARYIDAEKLCELARNQIDGKIDANYIMRFPAENVHEVKTGYWEWFEDWGFNGEVRELEDAGYRCSNCKAVPHESLYFDDPDVLPPFEYCPHCGCLMKEYGK